MATVTLTTTKVLQPNAAYPAAGVAPSTYSSGDTIKIPMDEKNVVLAITGATGAGTLTFDAGDGIGGTNDLAIATVKDKTVFVQLDSSSFEQISGANKGYAIATAATNGGSIVAVATL